MTQIIAFSLSTHLLTAVQQIKCVVHLAAGIPRTQPGVTASDDSEWGFLKLYTLKLMLNEADRSC